MTLLVLLCVVAGVLGIAYLRRGESHATDDLAALAAVVAAGCGTWAARESGSCCTCGHEWQRGEIIGVVTQAFELRDDGSVWRAPATRIACAVCVERTRHEGDLSLAWAREAGML